MAAGSRAELLGLTVGIVGLTLSGMDATTGPAKRATGVGALIQAWLLTLVCPGLGQIRLGARARGLATMAVVTVGLAWVVVAYVGPIYAFVSNKVSVMVNAPDPATMMSWVGDPELRKRLNAVSTLPAWIFGLSFLYAFVDSAYLAMGGAEKT
ncbi:MAG: hypothetical protein HY303_05320 [Candidatus Wallbacteria bacterium]|nr:hypothetical protein [Candidatus Wallbacteria bacterium]